MRCLSLWLLCLALTSICPAQPAPTPRAAIPAPASISDPSGLDNITLDASPLHLSSIEELARGLRSPDDTVRAQALAAIGLNDAAMHREVWSQTSPSKPMGKILIAPDQVEVRYAALGNDETRQAILAVWVSSGADAYAMVATPDRSGWKRIAFASCWCKYDALGDSLDEFVSLAPAPEYQEHYELIVRGSGGGTGIYVQNEIRLRVHGGKLVPVASFVSRRENCPPTGVNGKYVCTVDRRWFTPTVSNGKIGSTLLEASATFDGYPKNEGVDLVRDLEIRNLGKTRCKQFLWDEKLFRYRAATRNPTQCYSEP